MICTQHLNCGQGTFKAFIKKVQHLNNNTEVKSHEHIVSKFIL